MTHSTDQSEVTRATHLHLILTDEAAAAAHHICFACLSRNYGVILRVLTFYGITCCVPGYSRVDRMGRILQQFWPSYEARRLQSELSFWCI